MTSLPFSYESFVGGLNSKDAAFDLNDSQARDLQNVQGTQAGAIVKRNGLATFSSPADAFTSLFPLEETASPFLVGAGGTKLYKVTTGGVASSIKTGLTSGLKWEFQQMPLSTGQGPLWAMNGTDAPQQWDGIAGSTSAWTATTGAVPNGKYMALAGNRLWVAGVAANPSRLYWSDLTANGGARAWPPANVVDLDPNDGQQITAVGHVGPYLLVAKQRKLFVIHDFDTGANRRLSENIGVISHRSLAVGPEGTYFLAEDRGVYLTNGTAITPISDLIQPTVDSIQAGQRPNAAGTYWQGHYYLSVARTGTTNDTVLDYDATLKSWWLHTFGSSQFAVWHPSNVALLYSAKGTGAIVDQCFAPGVVVDNGTAFTWRWRGPWQSPSFYRRRRFPTPYYKKRFRQLRILGQGTVDVSLAADFAGGEVLRQSNIFQPAATAWAGTGTFGIDGLFGDYPSIQPARLFSLGAYRAISLVFSSTSTTADAINMYVLFITDRKDLAVS